MNDKILIINFESECIGYVKRTPDAFIEHYLGKITEHKTLVNSIH